MIFYIIGGIAGIIFLVLIVGLALPKERVVSRQGHFPVSPEILYGIVTNNNDWQYRSSLKNLVILENKDGLEIWNEIGKDGSVIHFQTKEKRPFSFYSFDIKAKLFTGYWTGEFNPDEKGGTVFVATEYIQVKNPIVKTLSYLFFDVGEFMDKYQSDLRERTLLIK